LSLQCLDVCTCLESRRKLVNDIQKSKVYTICRTLKKIKHSTWHFQFLSSNHSKNSNVYLCHHVLWFGGKLFLIETCPG
jgi:hypothetical protein